MIAKNNIETFRVRPTIFIKFKRNLNHILELSLKLRCTVYGILSKRFVLLSNSDTKKVISHRNGI